MKQKVLFYFCALVNRNGKMEMYFSAQVQGDPNQNPLFQMAVPLKLCISDPMLVKPKCV